MKRLITIFCCLFVLLGAAGPDTSVRAQQAGACAKALTPRLKKGVQAKIVTASSPDIPYAVLKGQPDHVSPVLRYLPVGTVVNVVDGPTCGSDGSNWWSVTLGDLKGLLAESNGRAYALQPFTGTAPDLLPSTLTDAYACIAAPPAPTEQAAPGTPAATSAAMPAATKQASVPEPAATGDATEAATQAAAEQPTPTDTPEPTQPPATALRRVVYASLQGDVSVSDDGAIGRPIAKFDPVPLSVDLSPDGSAILVVTYNGLYWVDAAQGTTVLIVDAIKFGLQEGGYLDSVKWLPDGRNAAVEITEKRPGTATNYSVWDVPIDGSFPPYRLDSGAQPFGGIQRSPQEDQAVLLSSNDVALFPKSAAEDTKELLQFVPRVNEGENNPPIVPALSWASDEKGFYTYVPISDEAPLNDTIGGHLWYIGLDNRPKDFGKIPKVLPTDYVIASGDGQNVLVLHNGVWTIRTPKTGEIVQTLPPAQLVFGWTPDNKGIVYRDATGQAKYLGVDGSTDSSYVPSLSNLYDIKWLRDGTAVFVARGKDLKLSLSVRQADKDPVFLSIVTGLDAYNGRALSAQPPAAATPARCKQ